MAEAQDPLIAELVQTQRDRQIVVVAAVVGILASAACGIAFGLGGFAHLGASGARNPAGLVFFVAPFFVCYGLGYVLHAVVRRARPRYVSEPELPEPSSSGASESRYSTVGGRFTKSV